MELCEEVMFICSAPPDAIKFYLSSHSLYLESAILLSRLDDPELSEIGRQNVENIIDNYIADDGVHLGEQLRGLEFPLAKAINNGELIHSMFFDEGEIHVTVVMSELLQESGNIYVFDFRDGEWVLTDKGAWTT